MGYAAGMLLNDVDAHKKNPKFPPTSDFFSALGFGVHSLLIEGNDEDIGIAPLLYSWVVVYLCVSSHPCKQQQSRHIISCIISTS
jgi:hypothetical protein